MRNLDVLIVGCGPAGSHVAACLAQAGMRVAVLEKHRMPRYKTCGGGVVGRALHWASEAVRDSVESRATHAVLSFSDGPEQFHLSGDAPLVWLTMRDRLDAELARRAQECGAFVLEEHVLHSATRRGTSWHLETSRGTLHAPCVIAADGAQSRMARAAGWPAVPACAPALEWELQVDDATLQRHADRVRFDFDLDLRGYAWIFPKRDRLSVGLLSTRRQARGLPQALQAYVLQHDLRPQRVEKHAWMIPIAPRPAVLARDGVFLVGDAAGLADPVTCEGISAALHSAALAARCMLQAQLDVQQAARLYDSGLRADLLAELRWARRLARVLYGPRWLRRRLFQRYGAVFCDAMGRVIAGTATYRSLLQRPASLSRVLRGR